MFIVFVVSLCMLVVRYVVVCMYVCPYLNVILHDLLWSAWRGEIYTEMLLNAISTWDGWYNYYNLYYFPSSCHVLVALLTNF